VILEKEWLIGAAAGAILSSLIAAAGAFAADDEGPWQIRLRGIGIATDESATVTGLGGSVDMDNAFMPEVDFTYFIDDHFAVELVLATAEHQVMATAGPIDLGSVWILPPTLLAQYHFLPDERFQPYVGVGVNYTMFYDVDGQGGLSIDYDNSFGWALQWGADIQIAPHWYANIDVKKVFLSTDVTIAGGAITADVDIDPWIVGVGIGYRF
jgi:outer membrane protein